MDHPLSRLLGEYQYTIVMTLQPVVSAVEKAGGLPRVDIGLDKDMQTRGTCPQHAATSVKGDNRSTPAAAAAGDEEDDILTMLEDNDDDDDVLDALNNPTNSSRRPGPSSEAMSDGDVFDEKLAKLRRELTQSASSGEDKEAGGLGNVSSGVEASEEYEIMDGSNAELHQNADGSQSGSRIYLNTGKSEPDSRVYQNIKQPEVDSRVYQNINGSQSDDRLYENTNESETDSRIYQNTVEPVQDPTRHEDNSGMTPSDQSFKAYQNVEDSELSNAPMFDSYIDGGNYDDSSNRPDNHTSGECNLYSDLPEPAFSAKRNESYGALPNLPVASHYDVPRPQPRRRDNAPQPRPRHRDNAPKPHPRSVNKISQTHPQPLDEATEAIIEQDKNVYEEIDNISNLLQGKDVSGSEDGPHLYEALEGLLKKTNDSTKEEVIGETLQDYEAVDGGMMSRAGPTERNPEEVEMKKMVVFNNLPPLVATVYSGDEVALGKLSDTAGSVLVEVVKMVQKSFGEYRLDCGDTRGVELNDAVKMLICIRINFHVHYVGIVDFFCLQIFKFCNFSRSIFFFPPNC